MSSIFELEWRHVYIWLGISALLSILFFADVFPGFRARLLDNFLPKVAPSGQIILVKIDDTSLNKIGQWPWPRQVFAELLERLESPAVVGIDVGFREASRAGSEDDAEFARALDESSFPVVLPTESNSDSESEGPLPLFAIHATEGFSDLFAEEDGVIRRAEVWKNNEPSFAYVVTAFAQRLETIPLSRNTNIARIAYHGQNGSYSSVPFIDVISGAVSADNFTNKIVLVGVTASDLQNFHRTPFGFVSGLEIQANIVDSLLTGRQWEESSEATVAAIILLSFLTTTAIVHARRVLILVLILAAVVGAYISIAAFGMAHFFALDLFYPLLAVAATALVGTVSQYLSTLERERALRETLTYLDSMVESMRDGIILVDSSLQVRLANKSARAIFGTNDLGLILNKCADALKKNIDLPDALRKSALSRATARLDEIIIAEQYFAVGIAPVQSPRDSQLPLGAIILLHDITHQKEIERIRHDFISMMVHDLRAPLGAIRDLSGELLSPDLMAEDRRSLYLNMMKDNSSKMLGLINDLLDIAKIEAGKFEVALTPVSVR
ncbi:MAG TPA: CHASE2 domain-containing protein, partial [Candidatus Paceibacterota bacterium]